jgi:prepilin-type processing-associated H-X9-DG protein
MDEQMPGGFSYETGEVEVTVELLEGKDQFWNCVHFGGSQFRPVEIERLAEFNRQGHGIHLLSEYFDGIGGEEVNQVGAALGYGIHAGDGGYVYTWITYEPDNHPVMKGVRQMATAYTPAGFVKTTGPQDTAAQLIGKMHHRDINSSTSPTHDYWHVAAWDGGVGRVVAQGGWNCIGNHFERVPSTGTNDVKTYCLNVAQWLGQYREGTSTYGYNNRVGRTARGPSADTVLLMDYCDWEIDRDGSPPDHDETFIAPRHGGRANVMFVDGHVRALRVEDIKPGMWTIETGD